MTVRIYSTCKAYSTKMLYRVLADIVVVVHLSFVVYAIFGGLLVLKWKYSVFFHIPALLWGTVVEVKGWICPLTPLENRLRLAAGQEGYPGGFVEHYILPILYPADLSRPDQFMMAALLIAANVVIYTIVVRRLRGRKSR